MVGLVEHAGRGGVAEYQSGGFERLTTSRCLSLCCVGDEVALEVGRRRIGHYFWHMVLSMLASLSLLERLQVCFSHSRQGLFSLAVVGA
jgi:hypothetical protein